VWGRPDCQAELGCWPTRGLLSQRHGRGDQQLGCCTVAERRLAHMVGQGQSHGKMADNGCCRSVGTGWQSMPSPTEHCRLLPNVQDPRWPPLESWTWAGRGQVGDVTPTRHGAPVQAPGPDERSGLGVGRSKQVHQTYPYCAVVGWGSWGVALIIRPAGSGRAGPARRTSD
jgi:hypothetical protein